MSRATVSIVTVLPHLLGTYGDSGNALALAYRLRARGIEVECHLVEAGEPVPESADIYLLGGGEDRAQVLATRLIGSSLERAVERGATVLGVCAGMQILGATFADAEGHAHPGLGLLDITTTRMGMRAVGEVVADWSDDPLIGFENHRGATHLGPAVTPLGTVRTGVGNGVDGYEGARQGRVFGTYLHGPVLALNPALADLIAAQAVGTLPPLQDPWVERARSVRLAR